MRPKVTFITSIVNLKWIDQCRYYLETEIKEPYEWLIVDNTGKIPVSYATANNFLAQYVETEFMCFLNDDVILLGDPLPAMLKQFDDPKIGVVGTKLSFPDWRIQHGGVSFGSTSGEFLPGHMESGSLDRGQVDSINHCPVTFAVAMTRTKLFNELEGLSEMYVNGFEDLDYCFKIVEAGYECVYTPSVPIIHVQHGSRTIKRDQYNWNMFKNKWGKHLKLLEEAQK